MTSPAPGTRWRSLRTRTIFVVDGFRTLSDANRTECVLCYNEADPRDRVLFNLSDWGPDSPAFERV